MRLPAVPVVSGLTGKSGRDVLVDGDQEIEIGCIAIHLALHGEPDRDDRGAQIRRAGRSADRASDRHGQSRAGDCRRSPRTRWIAPDSRAAFSAPMARRNTSASCSRSAAMRGSGLVGAGRLVHIGHGCRWSLWVELGLWRCTLAVSVCAAEHCVLVANDPPRELQGLIAVVGFRGTQRAIEDFARQADVVASLNAAISSRAATRPAGPLVLGADIGRLQGEIDASRRSCRPGRAA